jgi:uncharacterized lipoprotein
MSTSITNNKVSNSSVLKKGEYKMNAKLTTLKGILLIALLALALTACGMQAEAKDLASQPSRALAAEPAEEPVELPATGKPVAMVRTLTRIYRGPSTAEVIDVRTPSQQPIQLVGRSEDGAARIWIVRWWVC